MIGDAPGEATAGREWDTEFAARLWKRKRLFIRVRNRTIVAQLLMGVHYMPTLQRGYHE
jgi:hypothetical protein